ncbi:MAG: hypothetical protein FGM33_00460 [Candidatus Kapabacteria bacterium]|nr:hypothetical protein [Candidatus Kapabacteria bacterium]
MMSTTVYYHPRRTLVATWDARGPVPRLVAFHEYAPNDHSSVANLHGVDVTSVLGNDCWFVHSFPTSSDQPDSRRRSFELEEVCGLSASHAVDMECSTRLRSGLSWSSFVALRPDAPSYNELASSGALRTDLAVDIEVALACTPAQAHPWALHGRRGPLSITAVIGSDHQPAVISVQSTSAEAPYHQTALSELASVGQRFDVNVKHAMLFGDYLTLPMVDQVKSALRESGIKSTRLQPFRIVETSLDESTASRIIARAHVISPIMAGILPRLRS